MDKTSLDERVDSIREEAKDFLGEGMTLRVVAIVIAVYLVLAVAVGMYWSRSPELFVVERGGGDPVGAVTADTLIRAAETLLDKPGGFLSNDLLPPGVWLDNIPNWEYGVLIQVRDLTRALRESFSRSQSQSREDTDLSRAEPRLNFSNQSWAVPASESEYRDGIAHLRNYRERLADPEQEQAQFYARADNLRYWLAIVDTRLGSLSQRLSASVSGVRLNTDLAGDPAARQSTPGSQQVQVQTPWTEIDDVFFEARGTTWALILFLRAVEIDFADVLANKNAAVSLRQIIHELEATQQPLYSPMILNGGGFGVLANHSLVMASYVSRANAAIADLRDLLSQG